MSSEKTVTLRIPVDSAIAREAIVAGFAQANYFARITKIEKHYGYGDMFFVDVILPESLIMEQGETT